MESVYDGAIIAPGADRKRGVGVRHPRLEDARVYGRPSPSPPGPSPRAERASRALPSFYTEVGGELDGGARTTSVVYGEKRCVAHVLIKRGASGMRAGFIYRCENQVPLPRTFFRTPW